MTKPPRYVDLVSTAALGVLGAVSIIFVTWSQVDSWFRRGPQS